MGTSVKPFKTNKDNALVTSPVFLPGECQEKASISEIALTSLIALYKAVLKEGDRDCVSWSVSVFVHISQPASAL